MKSLRLIKLSRSLKKKLLNSIFFLCCLNVFGCGCFVSKSFNVASQDSCVINAPGWFFEPADINHPGALGFADPSIQGKDYSFFLAKCRALESLFNLENKKLLFSCPLPSQSISSKELEKLQQKLKEFSSKEGINFETEEIKLPVYSEKIFAAYAYREKKKKFHYFKEACECQLDKCEPKFLCNLTSEGYAGSLGIAFKSFSFKKQYEIAVKRAIESFLYAYRAEVENKELIKVIKRGYTSFRLHLKKAIVTPLGKKRELNFVLRALCMDKEGNLFVYVVCPDIKVKKLSVEKPCWIDNPWCLGDYVYVGIARENIEGLKGQIELALKRALIEMAKARGIKINSMIFKEIKRDPFGTFKIIYENTQTSTHEEISAKIVGIYKRNGILYVGVIER